MTSALERDRVADYAIYLDQAGEFFGLRVETGIEVTALEACRANRMYLDDLSCCDADNCFR